MIEETDATYTARRTLQMWGRRVFAIATYLIRPPVLHHLCRQSYPYCRYARGFVPVPKSSRVLCPGEKVSVGPGHFSFPAHCAVTTSRQPRQYSRMTTDRDLSACELVTYLRLQSLCPQLHVYNDSRKGKMSVGARSPNVFRCLGLSPPMTSSDNACSFLNHFATSCHPMSWIMQ